MRGCRCWRAFFGGRRRGGEDRGSGCEKREREGRDDGVRYAFSSKGGLGTQNYDTMVVVERM